MEENTCNLTGNGLISSNSLRNFCLRLVEQQMSSWSSCLEQQLKARPEPSHHLTEDSTEQPQQLRLQGPQPRGQHPQRGRVAARALTITVPSTKDDTRWQSRCQADSWGWASRMSKGSGSHSPRNRRKPRRSTQHNPVCHSPLRPIPATGCAKVSKD